MTEKDTRISLRINSAVKDRAQTRLAQQGLNLTDYIRMLVTNLANDDETIEVKIK